MIESMRGPIKRGNASSLRAKLAPGKRVRMVEGSLEGSSEVIVRLKKVKIAW